MPITKSAKKRVRQEKTRSARNKIASLKYKTTKKKSQELFIICQKQLAKVGNKGILKKKKISRKISSLNKKLKAI